MPLFPRLWESVISILKQYIKDIETKKAAKICVWTWWGIVEGLVTELASGGPQRRFRGKELWREDFPEGAHGKKNMEAQLPGFVMN